MWLSRIEADRLRNLRSVAVDLPEGLTLVAGRNGQGKTSLLESVYLLATGQSFRTRRLDEIVAWQESPLRVSGTVNRRAGASTLTVVIDGSEKRLLANGGEQDLEEFLGRLDIVDLTAERMKVLRGTPADRRRFLDRGVLGMRPAYLRSLGEYRRVLQQRNALLRAGNTGRDAEFDVWDERLIQAAGEIHRRRREYAVTLASRLGQVSRPLFPDGRELTLRYQPSPTEVGKAPVEKFVDILRKSMNHGRSRDRAVGHTCRGPHRDDLLVEMDGIDLRRFGSAGQVRASMVALKLGKLSLLHESRGEPPLFLMDDFDTDLDEIRASALAGFLEGGGFQAMVATSKEDMSDRFGVAFAKIRMEEGRARPA